MRSIDLSFVIPARNEADSLITLVKEIETVAKPLKKSFQIIIIDDGSDDNTQEILRKISKGTKNLIPVILRGKFGKSIALQAGFNFASGRIIITMDGDLQDKASEVPRFLQKLDEGYDLVVGWKKKRHDPWHKVIPSRILNNFLVPFLTGVKIHDTNCGYKAFRKDILSNVHLYGEQFRYLPIIAAKQNYKVTEIVVEHRKRVHGKTKFGIERNIKGLLDLITVVFLTGYLRRPGHFFGGLGIISASVGIVIGIYITFLRITTGSIQYRHPLLFLGILLIIVGVQFFLTGLVAELIIHTTVKFDSKSVTKRG